MQRSKIHQLTKYFKKKEKKKNRMIEDLYKRCYFQATSPISQYADSLVGTPKSSHFFEPRRPTSSKKAYKANLLWEKNHSTSEKLPILKKFKSDSTSKKDSESRVKFHGYKMENSESRVFDPVPRKLNFDNCSSERRPWAREDTSPRGNSRSYKIMEKLEHSMERDDHDSDFTFDEFRYSEYPGDRYFESDKR